MRKKYSLQNHRRIKHWLERNARLLSPDPFLNSSYIENIQCTGSMPSRNQIVNRIQSNVKTAPNGKLDIRGYFDWSNKMQQILVTTRLLIPI